MGEQVGLVSWQRFIACMKYLRRIDKHEVLHWFKGVTAKKKNVIGYVYVVLDTILMYVLNIT